MSYTLLYQSRSAIGIFKSFIYSLHFQYVQKKQDEVSDFGFSQQLLLTKSQLFYFIQNVPN